MLYAFLSGAQMLFAPCSGVGHSKAGLSFPPIRFYAPATPHRIAVAPQAIVSLPADAHSHTTANVCLLVQAVADEVSSADDLADGEDSVRLERLCRRMRR